MADTSIFWLHSCFFVLERHPKNLNIQSFYTTKASFDGEFQWELCTNFQTKCSWGRYNYVDFFQVTWFFLVFLPLKEAWRWLLSVKRGVHFYMIWSGASCINSKFIRDTRRFLVTLLRFCFVFEKYSKNLSVFTNKKTLVATLVKRVDLFLKNMWLHRV